MIALFVSAAVIVHLVVTCVAAGIWEHASPSPNFETRALTIFLCFIGWPVVMLIMGLDIGTRFFTERFGRPSLPGARVMKK